MPSRRFREHIAKLVVKLGLAAPGSGGGRADMRSSASLRTLVAIITIIAAITVFSGGTPALAEDDHGDYRFSATPISVGSGPVSGVVDSTNVLFDVDYFAFQARRGVVYSVVLDLVTVPNARVSIVNSLERGSGSSPGQTISRSVTQATVEWVARTTDTYFVEVAGTIDPEDGSYFLGDYTLGIFENTSLLDRHSETRINSTPIVVDNVYQGAISPWTSQSSLTSTIDGDDDTDYFNFEAQRGIRYTVEIDLGTSEGVEISIAAPFAGIEKTNDGVGSTLTWIAPSTATFYVAINGTSRVRNSSGTYALKMRSEAALQDYHPESRHGATLISFGNAHQGSISPATDSDFFSFPAERGIKYTMSIELGTAMGVELAALDIDQQTLATNAGVGTTLEWSAPASGAYLAVVSASTQFADVIGTYTLNLTSDPSLRDRHGESVETSTSVSLGNAHQGAISPVADRDYFVIQAQRGVSYSFDVELGTTDGVMISIETSEGEIVSTTGGVGTGLVWTAPSNGNYYAVISHSPQAPQGIGTYSLTVDANTSLEDRHPDAPSNSTPISYGTIYQGAISPKTDHDFFSFQADRGVEYTFDLIYGTAEAVTLTVNAINAGSESASRNFGGSNILRWIAPANQTYYVDISASPKIAEPTGTYSLKVTPETSLRDQHSDNTVTSTRIGFGNAIAGAISPADDYDHFSFRAEAGVNYTVDVNPGTVEAVRFSVENTQADFSASNFGTENSLDWTAPVTGGYILSVSASGRVENPIGTYQISVTPESDALPPEPAPLPTPNPTVVSPDDTALVVESRRATTGSTVKVPVILNEAQQITSLGFDLNYDADVLRVVEVLKGSRLSDNSFSHNADVPGVIRFGFAVSRAPIAGGSAAVVEFEVVGEEGSVSPLKLSDILVGHTSADPLDVRLVSGDLIVGDRILGDGDGNGTITALDALIALRASSQIDEQDLSLDVDGDGEVTAMDARLILIMARPG